MTTLIMSIQTSCSVKDGSVSLEDSSKSIIGSSLAVVGLGESATSLLEIFGGISLELFNWNNSGSDDFNGFGSGLMSATHLDIHLRNCIVNSRCSVLLVHVNLASTGLVSEEDAMVFDGVLFSGVDFAG